MATPRTKATAKRASTAVKTVNAGTASGTPVSKIMSREVVTVRSGTSLDSVVELMLLRGLSRVPVVDEKKRPLGIVSKTDLVEDSHAKGDVLEETTPRSESGFHIHVEAGVVDEVMTQTVVSVDEDASIEQVAELMVSRHVHGLPVVNAKGELVGFVSTMDVLAWLAGLR